MMSEMNCVNGSVQQINQYVNPNSGIYTPPINCHYTQLSTSGVDDSIMKISIGRNGKVFKAITRQANVNYIWYHKDKQIVEIWGPERNLPDAYKRIFDRIQKIITKVVSGEIELNEEGEKKSNQNNTMDIS